MRGGTISIRTCIVRSIFQSTRPVRGGTLGVPSSKISESYFNPPAPCGAGQYQNHGGNKPKKFQSTRPVRGGTCLSRAAVSVLSISIHPPRAGRDQTPSSAPTELFYFNPPAPCGAGQIFPGRESANPIRFQSTRPVRGGTCVQRENGPLPITFQSTRPVRGGTRISTLLCAAAARFQSTRPVRGGTGGSTSAKTPTGVFQSTRPVRGGTDG